MQWTIARRGMADVTYINGVAHVDDSELRMVVAKTEEKEKAEAQQHLASA